MILVLVEAERNIKNVVEKKNSKFYKKGDIIAMFSFCINHHLLLCMQKFFCFKGSHTSSSSRSNRLSKYSILHISSSENSFYAGLCAARFSQNISCFIKLQLPLEKCGIWSMTDRIKQSCTFNQLFFLGLIVNGPNSVE